MYIWSKDPASKGTEPNCITMSAIAVCAPYNDASFNADTNDVNAFSGAKSSNPALDLTAWTDTSEKRPFNATSATGIAIGSALQGIVIPWDGLHNPSSVVVTYDPPLLPAYRAAYLAQSPTESTWFVAWLNSEDKTAPVTSDKGKYTLLRFNDIFKECTIPSPCWMLHEKDFTKLKKFNDLNKGSIIGTSSFRREFQFKRIRNDLKYKLIRGNVDTRIKKLNEKNFDAIILSFAGLHSLKLDQNITQIFSTSEIIPSAGQGTIALQCRENDGEIIKILKKINHELTYKCVIAERDVLKTLNGDCETPIGVFANIKNNELNLETELFSLDGKDRFYESLSTELKNFKKIGLEVGTILKKKSKNSYKR